MNTTEHDESALVRAEQANADAYHKSDRTGGSAWKEECKIHNAINTPTPGPWQFWGDAADDVWIENFHAETIATVEPGINCVANARLLAASPYLLSTLIHARSVVKHWFLAAQPDEGRDESAWSHYEKTEPAVLLINDAILKATQL